MSPDQHAESVRGDESSCGHPNPVWWTDSRLWNEVMTGDPDGGSGEILCPFCFAVKAAERYAPGWKITGWRMIPEWSRA